MCTERVERKVWAYLIFVPGTTGSAGVKFLVWCQKKCELLLVCFGVNICFGVEKPVFLVLKMVPVSTKWQISRMAFSWQPLIAHTVLIHLHRLHTRAFAHTVHTAHLCIRPHCAHWSHCPAEPRWVQIVEGLSWHLSTAHILSAHGHCVNCSLCTLSNCTHSCMAEKSDQRNLAVKPMGLYCS